MTVEQATRTVAYGRAAQELALRRSELELAVHLGHVRTVPSPGADRRRVPQDEIDRLRAEPDFPDGLRERVRTVGTAQAAELARITGDRFTRLARTGHFTPVAFYLNRYRSVVWLYLAREVGETAARLPELLTGRAPREVRDRLEAGEDARPRDWRARRLQLLLRQAPDAWASAAAIASFLDPLQLAEVTPDPYERAHLEQLRPAPPPGRPESDAARAIADRLLLADDPDEILRLRTVLTHALRAARADRPAPRPRAAAPVPESAASVMPAAPAPSAEPGASKTLARPTAAGHHPPPRGPADRRPATRAGLRTALLARLRLRLRLGRARAG
ncbi:DUF6397 family protein [Streptomyces sp. TRM49041]|uniref:DUF6397 family protein n=1 Tax=Streptomyces sp. TRM49041 TaxID=2603216 RepID=UPI0011ED8B58|nr:DUF6397 family protein [Streptomyces sp. TRM49041]